MKWILLTLLTFSFNVTYAAQDPVVAEVNGITIKKSTLLSYHEQNLKFVQSNRKVTLESSLNDLINRAISLEDAKKNKVDERPDVAKKVNDVIYHAYISDELTPLLQKISVTDKMIKEYYSKYPEYKTSQILLRVSATPTSDELGNVVSTANDLHNQLVKKPSLFEKLAKEYSQISTAAAGGDMGYQPKVRLSPEYYEAISGKKIGYITNPIRTQYGVHIIKVTGVKKFEQIEKDMYKKIVYDVERDKVLNNYFEQKRKKAKVKINKKVLDNV